MLTISANILGEFLGMETLPLFLYSKEISFSEKIKFLNLWIYNKYMEVDPDVILIECPSGILKFSEYEDNFYGEIPMIISNAVEVDVGIVSLYANTSKKHEVLNLSLIHISNGKNFNLQYRKNVKGNKYGRQEEVYQCEDCSGCPYAEQCKKTDKNRTVRINRELTAMHQEVIENLESIQGALLRMNRSIQAEGTFGIMKNDRWYKRIVRRRCV